MATAQNTIDFLLDQLSGTGAASAKKMFGEYCLYLDGKPVALVCDDQLFLKPTNGHGKCTVPDDETYHARFPHLNPLPQAGEEANESLREFHVNVGRAMLKQVIEGSPYPGAKPHLLIPGDLWEEREWLCELMRATARELPWPKPKVKKLKP
ncbi:MAG: TfoX/Sxy family protein [Gallionella sp.]|jgi:DNA transformation protein|nr:TfoX/Sxy family protein [Gallionella sp.]MCK9353892.1 TfoX/Sxy family protein [Gallionella sp.]